MPGRTTPKKQKPAPLVLDLRAMAAREYAEAQRLHDIKVAAARLDFEDRLRDPTHNTELGLPAELPDEAVRILGHTMALDKHEAGKPDIDKVFVRCGAVEAKPVIYMGRRRNLQPITIDDL